ncbi:MAG: hypothetical protein V2J25_04305 [Desulfatiglans sp.]|jgi:hypothetical protein|nr:hypothetical protein [Desulfatiglans sp.]
MSYTIKPSDDRNYIILKVCGEINRELAMKQNLEAHALGAELGINRYLVDVTEARNVDSVISNYRFAYEEMRLPTGINVRARVATLVRPDDHSHDFVETVSRNAGLNVTIFRDREQAIQHLLKGIQND